jgi:hypothetical protein
MSQPTSPARLARLRTAAIVALGGALFRLLAVTWRVRVEGGEGMEALRARGAPFAFALWHGQLLPLLWQQRGKGVAILISEHGDGELIARLAHNLGMRTVRGSTTRGGLRALVGLIAELRAGREIAITPDGPRGPARRFAAGGLVAAQRSDSPIVPIAAAASRAWHLRSWDRFMIPKPFARITVVIGEPATVSPGDAAADAPRFEALLNDLSARAGV